MKCINCGAYIEDDDNFCYKCGSITAKGTNFFKDEENMKLITNGEAMKQSSRVSVLSSLLLFGVFLFVVMMLIRGNNLFAPFAYIEGIFNKYLYLL